MNKEEEIVQYFVINTELEMTPGKIAAQVAHAAVLIAVGTVLREGLRLVEDPKGRKYTHLQAPEGVESSFAHWMNDIFKKITLKGTQAECERLEAMGFTAIHDAGHTQVAPGSLTVVGLPPMTRREAKPLVGHLRLF